ncbi:MAG: hypothetical protein Q9217_002882 [Psora testacea]
MSWKTAAKGFQASNVDSDGQPRSKDKSMWSSMLDSVSRGKKLPEKNVIVLGGTPETQKEFLETLSTDEFRRPQDRRKKKSVVANEFALGYTYQDVLDADHEDLLARLSIYLLTEPDPAFAPLLKPLFTPQSILKTLLVILLDWNEPWTWVRQLRDWIILLRSMTASLSEDSKEALEETMKEWQDKKREVERNWREEDFDFVLQLLRTILMKHGASLIYTSNSSPNFLPTLIHSSLGIHSMLKKQSLKHNVVDRDKVLVPPNWDSWGKIRVLREGFDVERVSSGWSNEISISTHSTTPGDLGGSIMTNGEAVPTDNEGTVLSIYESMIPSPSSKRFPSDHKPGIEISVPKMQTFLASQQETIARLAAEEERSSTSTSTSAPTSSTFSTITASASLPSHERLAEQIGPVQVNMGGIQVDADDVVRKLQSQSRRDVSGSLGKEVEAETPKGKGERASISTPEMKAQNEALQSFFSGLMKRGASNSPRGTSGKAKEGWK